MKVVDSTSTKDPLFLLWVASKKL